MPPKSKLFEAGHLDSQLTVKNECYVRKIQSTLLVYKYHIYTTECLLVKNTHLWYSELHKVLRTGFSLEGQKFRSLHLIFYTHFGWIKDLNRKNKVLKLIEKNTDVYLYNLRLGKNFWKITLKSWITCPWKLIRENQSSDYLKIKNWSGNRYKVKDKTYWRKILRKYIYNNIYNKYLYIIIYNI